MKLSVQYNIDHDIYVEKEFIGDDRMALEEEAKNHPLFKQCTSAIFEIIEEDDGDQ